MKPRILIVNPNTSPQITAAMVKVAKRFVADRAEIIGETASFGAAALQTEEDLKTARLAVLSMIGAHEDCDGVVIAAFGDPALQEARDACRIPIAGLGEAGIRSAAAQGRRFAILTLGPALRHAIVEKVDRMGLRSHVTDIAFLSCGILELCREPEKYFDEIIQKAEQLKNGTAAEALLLAGAPFSGMAASLRDRTNLPFVDGLEAAVTSILAQGYADVAPHFPPTPVINT